MKERARGREQSTDYCARTCPATKQVVIAGVELRGDVLQAHLLQAELLLLLPQGGLQVSQSLLQRRVTRGQLGRRQRCLCHGVRSHRHTGTQRGQYSPHTARNML